MIFLKHSRNLAFWAYKTCHMHVKDMDQIENPKCSWNKIPQSKVHGWLLPYIDYWKVKRSAVQSSDLAQN